ncbi:hypothetical protein JTE90_015827 [Oedothorax gibbosus]|uniref:Uncharacterized protein n=1 Tax=Oedothorax gibbosus TaxID=931172 RepID=A0AAV6TTZ3_9ARAC|nr:hypothetical protein JTE90_015827 [Oedothorax gibbosus]
MSTPKCALCSGPHTANYRQCPKRPIPASQRENRDVSAQVPQPPATLPPPISTQALRQPTIQAHSSPAAPSTSQAQQASPINTLPPRNDWVRPPFTPRQVTLTQIPQTSTMPDDPKTNFDLKSLFHLIKNLIRKEPASGTCVEICFNPHDHP